MNIEMTIISGFLRAALNASERSPQYFNTGFNSQSAHYLNCKDKTRDTQTRVSCVLVRGSKQSYCLKSQTCQVLSVGGRE